MSLFLITVKMKRHQLLCLFLFIFVSAVLYKSRLQTSTTMPYGISHWEQLKAKVSEENPCKPSSQLKTITVTAHLPVLFLETTETLMPHALAICSVESTARIYQDRPVQFYLRGFKNRTCLQSKTECPGLRLLTGFPNVQLLHLDPKVVLKGTPFASWYDEEPDWDRKDYMECW